MDKGIIIHSVITHGNKFLILKRIESTYLGGYWDMPGGTLKDGEDPASGAIREAKEETGLDIYDLSLFFYRSDIDTKKNKQFLTLVFSAKTDSDIDDIRLSAREHTEYAWASPEEMKGLKTVPWLEDCIGAGKLGS